MGDISKEELNVLLETYKTFNVLLEKVLVTQEQLASQQDRMAGRLCNGMAKDIAAEVTKQIGDCSKVCTEKINTLSNNVTGVENENSVVFKLNKIDKASSRAVGYAQSAVWIIGIISVVTAIATVVATVVLRGIDNRALFKEEIKQIITEIKK